MLKRDSQRHIGILLDHRPALVGNLVMSTPPGLSNDVTIVHNITPGIFKEVIVCALQLILWEAMGKPIWIADQPTSTVTAYKGNQSRYLSEAISGCIAEV